ncbi:MAG: Hsp20/alpha crystallin family protein [Daejeonella sp.]|uniref:Hsp20/alpha crystallin family protein n=1 Tax=Daejeonella sp. JGW-45 TaxID=3034148 RepID=UPI0023EAA5A9|nr:Hsp20/alpha crystallin family protein [Daejeonella sp. JGW-45]
MTLVKFTNGQKDGALKSPYTDIFNSLFNPEPYLAKSIVARVPAVNIGETESEFRIELAVPGLKKDDFKINVEKDQLSISADKKQEDQDNADTRKYNRREFNYNSFTRTFTLPESADQAKIQAEYTDGILFITVAKKEEAKIQVREIAVK